MHDPVLDQSTRTDIINRYENTQGHIIIFRAPYENVGQIISCWSTRESRSKYITTRS